MGFIDHLLNFRQRRKTATTTTTVHTVKHATEEPLPPEQGPLREEQEVRPLTPSVIALAPSSLASSSVNVDGLEFTESRDLVYLLGNTLDDPPDCFPPPTSFPQFEYLLQPKQAPVEKQQHQQVGDISVPRRSKSSLRSNRLLRALPGAKNDFRLSLSIPSSRRGLKNARSTPNFDTVKPLSL